MTEIDITYEGDLSTRCVHSDNKSEIVTDAPKDNQGLGRVFSPTDLFAASLGSCMLTLMGIGAKKLNVDIKGTRAKVTKEMAAIPLRRVGKLKVEITCPHRLTDEVIAKLVQMADMCPVKKSLHPDIVVECTYQWGS
ncbi:MAG: OsmC family protein [Verrucomicrobia bacterium]|nr:OsmC family protein [Verrucomicrobiota bacterium]